jgi:demethylmenaquinone methyltransferase/2-methoxy-6-polyprenyl-1,4-benzoquinol methylase
MTDLRRGSSETGADTSATASFGFREIPEGERQGLVNEVFSTVAGRYDLMNDLMSAGLHRLWKDDLVAMVRLPPGSTPFRLLDVAGGTADVAIRFARFAGDTATVVLSDISSEMLEAAKRKIDAAGLCRRISLTQANAEALPFPDKSFDAVTIAFGIRNVTHIDRALAEAYRTLRIGGQFLCLEFSECRVPLLDRIYDFHSFEVIPRLGKLAAGSAEPYRYLVESIRRFPKQEAFAALIREQGFARVAWRNLTGGIAAIHSAWRL